MFNHKLVVITCLALVALLIGSTFVNAQTQEASEPAAVLAEKVIMGESKPYTLGKEDVVEINVQNQAEFSGSYVIGPDGMIQYSFAGDVKAEGLTKQQLKQALINKLARFVKNPVISVVISAYRSKNVYILGEVYRPGKYAMEGDTLLLRDAIIQAGLPTRDAALTRVHVIKSDVERPTFKKVNLLNVLYKGKTKDDINLVPDDIIVVPSTVPSEINRALANLLAPFSRAQATEEVLEHRWGAGEED